MSPDNSTCIELDAKALRRSDLTVEHGVRGCPLKRVLRILKLMLMCTRGIRTYRSELGKHQQERRVFLYIRG